jgi:hypothetical protein
MVDVICIDSCASDSESWWKSFSINNTYLKCKLDSGAQANAMSMSAFNMLMLSLWPINELESLEMQLI